MRTQESQILAQKIINASEGYLIIPNWDTDNYKDNVEGLVDEITDLLCRDLKNNNAKPSEEKIDMLGEYVDTVNSVLKDFEQDHGVDVRPIKHLLDNKQKSFAFEIKKG